MVVLSEIGLRKIDVIKVVRELTGLGLKDAKDLVEAAPRAVLTGLNDEEKAQVRELKNALARMPVEQARLLLQQVQQQEGSAPPEKKQFLQTVKTLVQEKIGGKP